MAALRAGLVRAARRWSGDADEAEDLVQHALVRALESPRTVANWPAWLTVVMRRLWLDRRRKQRRESRAADTDPDDLAAPQLEPTLDGGIVHLERALQRCPPKYREVCVGYYLQGLSYDDLAERLGVPVPTVATWLHRARHQLRERSVSA